MPHYCFYTGKKGYVDVIGQKTMDMDNYAIYLKLHEPLQTYIILTHGIGDRNYNYNKTI